MATILTERVGHSPTARRIWFIRGLVALGVLALLFHYDWWRDDGRLTSPWLSLALALAMLWTLVQFVGNWLLYLTARRRPAPGTPPGELTVDVFVTAYREPHALVERSLRAACAMRGAHSTWLLDDGEDPALAALAERLGAGYLTRADRVNAKAGNLNAALARTNGDVVAVFDVDHAPLPDFLERSLGYFVDPAIGFVQVMLTFRNDRESWVARAATESSLDWYNPTSVGADGAGGVTMMGSNSLIRRSALASIGGYRPGLAEDLATSLALHAAGWQSAYVAEPLAPGLAPADLAAWFTQQLKWARGVFELLLTAYPRLFPDLTWGQRLSYAVRMTRYWIGLTIGVHLLLTIAVLLTGGPEGRLSFQSYLLSLVPLGVIDALIRQVAMQNWHHPAVPNTAQWRAVVLAYATWPIYTLAWGMAVCRLPLAFRPTPKSPRGGLNPLWLLPQLATAGLLGGGILYSLASDDAHAAPLVLAVAVLETVPLLVLLPQSLRAPSGAFERGGGPSPSG